MQISQNKSSIKPLKIVVDQQIIFAEEVFSLFGEVELVNGRSIDHELVRDADILLVRSVTKVNKDLLNNTNVSFVASATSGIDHIDTDYLNNSDIYFSHAPGSNSRSVAEYILSSLLVLSEQQGVKLTDRTVGIIGCGQVGSRVKRFMEVLGVKCLINDPPLANETSNQNQDNEFVELEELSKADIVTLHVPLIMKGDYPTYKLVDKNLLKKLKKDITIINTSRGEVIDEMALLNFKQLNNRATLILDVWCNEPHIDFELLQKTFIATPHIAGYSYDGKIKATEMLFDSLNKHLDTNLEKPDLLNSEQELMSIDDDTVQLAVLQSYDVRSDAIALGNLDNVNENERAAYFDNLRKNYPIRREFMNRTINTGSMSENSKQQLQQLGFNINSI